MDILPENAKSRKDLGKENRIGAERKVMEKATLLAKEKAAG